MEMTEYEIRQSYKFAKDKRGQVKTLAELNLCRVADIKRILQGGSVNVIERKKSGKLPDQKLQRKIVAEYNRGGVTMKELSEKYGITQYFVSICVKTHANA